MLSRTIQNSLSHSNLPSKTFLLVASLFPAYCLAMHYLRGCLLILIYAASLRAETISLSYTTGYTYLRDSPTVLAGVYFTDYRYDINGRFINSSESYIGMGRGAGVIGPAEVEAAIKFSPTALAFIDWLSGSPFSKTSDLHLKYKWLKNLGNFNQGGFSFTKYSRTEPPPPLPDTKVTSFNFKQFGEEWSSETYDSTNKTISQKGCALTSLAMSLSTMGININPSDLNKAMTANGAFDSNGNIVWGKLSAAVGDKASFALNKINSNTNINGANSFLDKNLNNNIPTVVGVKLSDKGPGHFVLVVGRDNGRYLINDPGSSKKTYLDDYSGGYETRGNVSPTVNTNAEGVRYIPQNAVGTPNGQLQLSAPAGVYFKIANGGGKVTELRQNGDIVNEIPNLVTFFDAIELLTADDSFSDTNTEKLAQTVYWPTTADEKFLIEVKGDIGTPLRVNVVFVANGGKTSSKEIGDGSTDGSAHKLTVVAPPAPEEPIDETSIESVVKSPSKKNSKTRNTKYVLAGQFSPKVSVRIKVGTAKWRRLGNKTHWKMVATLLPGKNRIKIEGKLNGNKIVEYYSITLLD